MFEQLIESSSRKARNKRRWLCFAATAAVWVPGLMAAVLAGVLAYDGRLSDQYGHPEKLVLLLPPSSLGGPSAPKTQPVNSGPPAFVTPRATPTDPPRPSNGLPVMSVIGSGSVPGPGPGDPGSDPNGDPNGTPYGVPQAPPGGTAPPPEPTTPPPTPKKEEPQRATPTRPHLSVILQGTAVKRVQPAYPQLAKVSGRRGAVVVEVVVDEAGNVLSARALSGHPLLRAAAEGAARGWKWNPTRLNGVAVQVVGTITFNFVL